MKEEEIDKIIEKEIDELWDIFESNPDLVLVLIRYHLLIENILERIILGKIDRGDRIIEKANLSFFQKVVLVDAFNEIDDSIIQSVKKLNQVRNTCAHDREKRITKTDIESIGKPLGKKFTKIRLDSASHVDRLARQTFAAIFSPLLSKVLKLES